MFSKMVDMRHTPAEKKEESAAIMPDVPDYPYGLCLSLGEDELQKLDLDGNCEVGDTVDLRAFARVTSISSREVDGRPCRRLELQVTSLAVENEDTEAPDDEATEKMGRYKPMRRGY